MSRPDILQAGPLMPYLVEDLSRRYALWPLQEQAERAAFLAREGDPFTAAVTSTFVGFPAMAIALLLACSRNLVANDRYLRGGSWKRLRDPALGPGPAGRLIGIVGLGRIGQVIARRLQAFGCIIADHTRNARPEMPWRHEPDLLALAREAAALIVIVPGGPATEQMINAEVMDALGPEGLLINVARGSVVGEAALVVALTEGRLGGADLDVYQDVPNVPEALFGLDHAVPQPHQGSATRETRRAMADIVIGNLDSFFAGEALLTPLASSPSLRSVTL